MLNLLFHEIFIVILFPYRSGGWKKVCLDGSYIAKCQITNTSFSVLMFQDNLWRSGKCYINYLIFGASFNGLLFMDIVYCLLYIVFIWYRLLILFIDIGWSPVVSVTDSGILSMSATDSGIVSVGDWEREFRREGGGQEGRSCATPRTGAVDDCLCCLCWYNV